MRTKNVCELCAHPIEAPRLALELTICEACAKEIPGNILRNELPGRKILDATLDAMAPDKGNALPTFSAGHRTVRCLKCGGDFILDEPHSCLGVRPH